MKRFKSESSYSTFIFAAPNKMQACYGFQKDPKSFPLVTGQKEISLLSVITDQSFVLYFLLHTLVQPSPKYYCGFLSLNHPQPNKILVPHSRQEATLR